MPARLLRAALVLGVVGLAAPPAHAQAWPSKQIRIVVAGPAGATADIAARLLGDAMERELGRPVIVDPKPGAAGAIAVNELRAAPRDGHTVLVAVNSLVSEVPHIVRLKFDMATAIKPLAELARGGLVLVATPSLPASTLPALISYAKANPGKLSYASYSPGTMSHILGLQLNKAAGLDLVHAGYKGSTPALADVMGGHVPLMFDGMPTSVPLIKSGKVKAIAVSTPARSPLLPDVPTFTELGYPQLEAIAWMGLWVTPDVPAAVQARLREAALKVMAQPQMAEKLREIGFEPGQPRSSDDLARALRADYERVGAILKSINFKPE
jgi:tripartite-type tricarboxylate transporter receptor subunit TctC